MKGSRWFIVFIVAFLFIMFAIEYHLPKNFVWKPTFGHHDEQPFGCAVFDSVLSSSLPQGYTFSRKASINWNRKIRRNAEVYWLSLIICDCRTSM